MPAPSRARITPAQYAAHARAAALIVNDYHLRYLVRLYRLFEGDLQLAIVLGEVAHHNVSAVRQSARSPRELSARVDHRDARASLLPTNAFSIAQATGIPRETVRRKVAWLVQRGLLLQDARANLLVAPAAAQYFADANVEMVNDLLDAALQIGELFPGATR